MNNSTNSVERLSNSDNEIAILLTNTYGPGWSTWNHEELREFLIFDKTLIQKIMNKEDYENIREYVRSIYPDANTIGLKNVSVFWITKDVKEFSIENHNGFETVRLKSDYFWLKA